MPRSSRVIRPDELKNYLGHPPASDDFRDLTSLGAGSAPYLSVRSSGEGSVGTLGVSSRLSDKFNRTISGKLETSIEESVKVALTMLMHGKILPEDKRDRMLKSHFHIHFNEGGTEKDGPSAGVIITLGIVSNVLNLSLRKKLTGTGEVTLSGDVLPIGGTRSKVLAAVRRGFREIFIPVANANDLDDLPEEIKKDMDIVYTDMESVRFKILAKDTSPKKQLTIYCIGKVSDALTLAFPDRF